MLERRGHWSLHSLATAPFLLVGAKGCCTASVHSFFYFIREVFEGVYGLSVSFSKLSFFSGFPVQCDVWLPTCQWRAEGSGGAMPAPKF